MAQSLFNRTWRRGMAAMPYGKEDYDHLSQVFVKKATAGNYLFGAGVLAVGVVAFNQWRTNMLLGQVKEEVAASVDQKIKTGLEQQQRWLEANLPKK